jgi:protein-disulfide isomerase
MRPDASKKLAAATPKKGPNPVVIGAVVAAVVIVGVVVAILVGNNGKSASATAGSGNAVPVGVVGGTGGGILANAATAKTNAPTIDLYEDFQCSNCGRLEKVMGPEMFSLAKGGQIKLVVHVLSFLDVNLKNDSSTRSANAGACAADAGKFLEYHRAVFAGQPAEGVGYTDAQLTSFANTAGIVGSAMTTWQRCTSSAQHAQYVTDTQTAAEKAGVFGTPTVKLNGKDITSTLVTPAALVATVAAATK